MQRDLIKQLHGGAAQPTGQRDEAFGVGVGLVDDLGCHLIKRQAMEDIQQPCQRIGKIRCRAGHLIDDRQHCMAVTVEESLEQIKKQTARQRPQHLANGLGPKLAAAKRKRLIHEAEGVPHAAIGGTGQ